MNSTLFGNTTTTGDIRTDYDKEWAARLYEQYWRDLQAANLHDLQRVRDDLMTWRRGSAQMVLKVNPGLNNVSIYSVLVTNVEPTPELYRHLLHYNVLQRRETLGMLERDGTYFVVLKYTMELDLASDAVLIRHLYAMQEIADQLDTELANQFGGVLHFDDWDKLDQAGVDNLIDSLFG